MARSFKIPDLKDNKGRLVQGARIRARRCDTHAWLDEEVTTDEHGNATFSTLPDDVDAALHATWGGTTTSLKERWFYSHINAVTEGGTGASDAATGRTNLGVGTGDSPQLKEINLGHASDTTLTRKSAGLIAVEGDNLIRASDVDDTPVNGQTAVPVSSNWAFDHNAATTGVHGAGSDHVALFGVASTVVSKFTPLTTTGAIWRREIVSDTPFVAKINSGGSGGLTATNVPYDTDSLELSLPDPTTHTQWGKVVLHNLTRANSRLITDVNVTTDVITTESSSDDWADNDDITTASQTCVNVYTARKFFDIDVSAEIPSTATSALLYFSTRNLSGTGAAVQDQLTIHPFETISIAKISGQSCTAAYQSEVIWAVMPMISQKFCVSFGTWGQVTGSGMLCIIQLRGYWE